MAITLETVLGSTNIVDEDRLLYVHIDKLVRNKPIITSNFARNVNSGYVAVEIPDDIEQFLLNTFTKDEQDIVTIYMLEEEERVEEHNRKERQKIENWENIEQQKIEEWESNEKQKTEDYELETAIIEEENQQEKVKQDQASRTPYLIFDALGSKGHNVATFRSQYEKQGFLTSVRSNMIVTQLNKNGIVDEYLLEDVRALVENRELLDEDRTWLLLEEQLGVIIPTISTPNLLELPTPPIPEPRPEAEQRPETIIKEVLPLLEEFENVVLGSYKGLLLEDLNLTHQAWKDAGINPEEIYTKVRKDIKLLNDQYMLVKVVGNGNGDIGSLTLAELDINQKKGLNQRISKSLRNYFQRPADIADEAYMLSAVLQGIVREYLTSNDEEAASLIKSPIRPYLMRTIYDKIIDRKSSISISLFPAVPGIDYNGEDIRKFKDIAEKVDTALKNDLLGGEDSIAYTATEIGVPVMQLVDTVKLLIDSVPEEIYRLRYLNDNIRSANHEISRINNKKESGSRLTSNGIEFYEHIENEYRMSLDERDVLIPQLGTLVEGASNWSTRSNQIEFIKIINAYGLGKRSNYALTAK